MDIFTSVNIQILIPLAFIIMTGILLSRIWYYRKKLAKMQKVTLAGINMSSGTQQKLIQRIMEIAKQQAQAESCSLYFVNDETKELFFGVALGEKGTVVKELRFKIDDSFVAGWVATYKKTLNIKDIKKDKRFKNRSVVKDYGLNEKSFLTMPIIFGSKLMAILQLINKQDGGCFTKADEEMMELLIETQIAPNLEKAKYYNFMQELFNDSIQTIANAIDARDEYTQGHCMRVAEYSVMIGKELGLEEEELVSLRYSAVLHDVGKIGIKDSILNSKAKLTEEEFEEMKSHVIKGTRILEQIAKTNPVIVYGVKFHHERYDGKGYCEGLSGDDIPLFARIIAVADTFDAMTSNRPYRKKFPEQIAVSELIRCAGTQYDKKVVDAFVRCFEAQA